MEKRADNLSIIICAKNIIGKIPISIKKANNKEVDSKVVYFSKKWKAIS